MSELPQGTVTLVFTDIEGSTRLLHHLGDAYEDVLATHRRVLREAFSSHGGIEVDTQGDALFYAFSRARDALQAAAAAQRALADHEWPDGAPVRVRLGIHSGEPTVSPKRATLAKMCTSRPASAPRPTAPRWSSPNQQHTCSRKTSRAWTCAPSASTASKTSTTPWPCTNSSAAGLEADFPPLRTPAAAHPTNVPARLEPLIGRDQDVVTLTELLQEDDVYLVTLTGPGGTGKTRLALALGQQLLASFPDGVFFVDLSAVTDPDLVIPAIAHALSLRETPGRPLQDTLTDHLAHKETLLILDNLEQVIDAAPAIASLLASAPQLKVLATSREPLRVTGERDFSLSPLQVPSQDDHDPGELERYAAVTLFVRRARAVKADFFLTQDNAADVAAICRRLDGLPLAIELAAARVNLLSPAALLSRLDAGLKVLTSGRRDAAERQKTLRGAIEWSYDLLSLGEQKLFRRLGVFAGGFTLEAAEQVCDRGELDIDVLEALASLVDKSLVRTHEDPDRFSLLETIREFALEQSEKFGESENIRWLHAQWYAEVARTVYTRYRGGEQAWAIERLNVDDANMKSALRWAVTSDPSLALQLVNDVWRSWWLRGQLSEARSWLEVTTSAVSGDGPALAKALRGLSVVARGQGDLSIAREAAERSTALYRGLDDELGLAGSVGTLADIAVGQGDLGPARRFAEEGRDLYAKNDDSIGVAVSLANLGYIALLEKRLQESLALSGEAMRIYERENDKEGIGVTALNMGYALLDTDQVEASVKFERARLIAKELRYAELMWGSLVGLANIACRRGDHQRAASLLREAEETRDAAMISAEPFEQALYERTRRDLAAARRLGNHGHT